MLRTLITAGALGLVSLAATPVLAADAPAAPAAPAAAFSVADTDIGTLLDNPATKAILDKYMPGMSTNPQIDMARAMTLKQVQSYAPDQFKDETLAKIDADLAKIPAPKK
jgi:para-nitrobenzyl esterase